MRQQLGAHRRCLATHLGESGIDLQHGAIGLRLLLGHQLQVGQSGQHGERQGRVVAKPVEGGRERLLAILPVQPALAVPIGIRVVYLALGHGTLGRPPRQQLAQGARKRQRRVDPQRQLRAGQHLQQVDLIVQCRAQQGIQIRRNP